MKITTNIQKAIQALNNGELVAFPTETVYGLGANARNPEAISKVFAAKGRPSDHPLIVHIANKQQMPEWAYDIPEAAWLLADRFWPGPLTLILKKQPDVSDLITGGQDSIALRVPNHPLTLELLKDFNGGLVGPSANKYGHVSPTTAQHVIADLNDSISFVLDGGACNVGIESTIVNLLGATPLIMRQGEITAAQISSILNCEVNLADPIQTTVRTSGSHASHYAPRTTVFLCTLNEILNEIAKYSQLSHNCSVISLNTKPSNIADQIYWQTLSNDPKQYAQQLYACLREHDQLNNKAIFIEHVPNLPEWAAINDRLTRAAFKK